MIPATLTWPIPWSMLTDVAPVTFHNRVDVPPALMVAGLLLNTTMAGGVPAGGVVVTYRQPGMRINNANTDKERIMSFFKIVTSNNLSSTTFLACLRLPVPTFASALLNN